jgi:hypothetical protein
MHAARRHAFGIVARTLLMLPIFLAAWHFAGPVLSWVPGKVAAPVIGAMAGKVTSTALRDNTLVYSVALETPYGQGPPRRAEADLEVLATHYTFGMAIFLALSLAARESRHAGRIAIGAAVLLVLPAFAIACDALKQLGGTPDLAPFLSWGPGWREAIALGFQVGTLLLPTLAPIALWMGLNRAAWDPAAATGEGRVA